MSPLGTIGFVGLGQMGGPMCANIAQSGQWPMVVYDSAGTAERAPPDASIASSAADLAETAETILLSLPNGDIVANVTAEIAATSNRRAKMIVDLSTIGVSAARRIGEQLSNQDIRFVDAPVSGGRAGAIAGSITVMCAGPTDAVEALKPVFDTMAGNIIPVGTAPGQGQAMKLLNNFLSAVAMSATSEAIRFGETQNLDMDTMLKVLNVSSGRNTATSDKFPNRIATDTYDAGFALALMAKDVGLYIDNVRTAGAPHAIGTVVAELWADANAALPGADFTRIYDFVGEQPSADASS